MLTGFREGSGRRTPEYTDRALILAVTDEHFWSEASQTSGWPGLATDSGSDLRKNIDFSF